jgi:hypothetical protein
VVFTNNRAKLLSTLLASSFLVQSNLACFAETSSQSPTTRSDDSYTEQMPDGTAYDGTILKSPLLVAASQAPDSYVLTGGSSMTPDQAQERIDELTKQILLKEIALERYNLHYTMEVARQGRWKGWRYAGLQEVNAGMGLTGAIISTAYRGARLNDSAKVKPCIQESANYIPEIGSYIGAGAAVLEFGINGYHDLIARRHGYSPAAAMRTVSGLKNDIDRMMAEREALTKIEAGGSNYALHAEIDAAEGKVLRDLRDQGLQEFERFHIGARRLLAFQQMQYFFDFAKTPPMVSVTNLLISLCTDTTVATTATPVLFLSYPALSPCSVRSSVEASARA